MTDYLISQAVLLPLLLVWGVFLMWRYQVRISRPAKLREFQYRMFAIRDSVIRMVAEGQISEVDEDWQELYEFANDSAKVAAVSKFRNGFSFVLSFIGHLDAPSDDRIERLRALPELLRARWAELAASVLTICWDGSWFLRYAVRIGQMLAFVRKWQHRRWSKEATNLQRWNHVSNASGGNPPTGFLPWRPAHC